MKKDSIKRLIVIIVKILIIILVIVGMAKCLKCNVEQTKQQEIEWTTGDSTFVKKQDGFYISPRN